MFQPCMKYNLTSEKQRLGDDKDLFLSYNYHAIGCEPLCPSLRQRICIDPCNTTLRHQEMPDYQTKQTEYCTMTIIAKSKNAGKP